MKKTATLILASSMAFCGLGFADYVNLPLNSITWETPIQNLKVINLNNLTESVMNEIKRGQYPEIAIEFSAHTILPFSFFLKGDFVNLIDNEENIGAVEILQTFYARCVDQELILSANLTDWKPFIEFITGHISASLGIQDGKPSFSLGTEVNRR